MDDNRLSSGAMKIMQHRRTATLFIEKESWIHRLHPFTKLAYILLTGVTVYAGPSGWMSIGSLVLVNMIAIASCNILKETYQVLGRILLPLIGFMIPIHGFLYPGNTIVLLDVNGILFYQEGLLFALATLAKLAVVLMASLLFVFSTHPADLITAVADSGKSPSLAYLLGSPLLLLATMRERISVIQAAQQARGLNTQGNVIRRFRSLAPLIIPLVTGAIVEIEQRSIALEVRGFTSTSGKTSLRILADSKGQLLARWLMLAISAALLVFRFAR